MVNRWTKNWLLSRELATNTFWLQSYGTIREPFTPRQHLASTDNPCRESDKLQGHQTSESCRLSRAVHPDQHVSNNRVQRSSRSFLLLWSAASWEKWHSAYAILEGKLPRSLCCVCSVQEVNAKCGGSLEMCTWGRRERPRKHPWWPPQLCPGLSSQASAAGHVLRALLWLLYFSRLPPPTPCSYLFPSTDHNWKLWC